MTKKKIKLLIIALLIVITLGLVYYAFWSVSRSRNGGDEGNVEEGIIEIKVENSVLEEYNNFPVTLDTDSDGLPDKFEVILGTDKNQDDTDGDGYEDGEEVASGYNPFSSSDKKLEEDFLLDKNTDLDELFRIRQKILANVSDILCEDTNHEALEGIPDNDKLALAIENLYPCSCSMIDDSYYRNKCFTEMGSSLGDLSMCNYITYGENYDMEKDGCIFLVAVGGQDASLCMDIKGSEDKSNCLLNIAYETKAYETCADIADTEIRDYCYYNIAVSMMDGSICENMQDRGENYNTCISKSLVE